METKSCTTCIHLEVCAMCKPFTPACAHYMEVVLCKNCTHSKSNGNEGWNFCKANLLDCRDDDFCSIGEMKKTMNICICCGAIIPECTQVCKNCLCYIKEETDEIQKETS